MRPRPALSGAACCSSGVRLLAVVVAFCVFAAPAVAASATVTWETAAPTRGQVAYGVDGLYLYSARESAATTRHSVTLDDLAPSTTYSFRAGSVTGQVTTSARQAEVRFGTDNTRVTANGSLFFPVLSYEQCASTLARALALGVNTFVQVPFTGCAEPAGAVTPVRAERRVRVHRRAPAGTCPMSPTAGGSPPASCRSCRPRRRRAASASSTSRSTSTAVRRRSTVNSIAPTTSASSTLADVVGFDMYPIVEVLRARSRSLDIFRAQRELMTAYAPGKPTFQWIETSKMTGECRVDGDHAADRQRRDLARGRRRCLRDRVLHEQLDRRSGTAGILLPASSSR